MDTNDLPEFLGGETTSAPQADAQTADDAAQQGADQNVDAQQPETAPAADGEGQGAETPQADPAQAGDAQQGAEGQQEPQGHSVPLSTFLELRDKLTEAERRLKDIEEATKRQQAQAEPVAPQPLTIPQDDDPVELALFVQRRDISKRFAVLQHGQQLVDEAWQWGIERANRDPIFNLQVRQADDPAAFVVEQFQAQRTLSELTPEELAAFRQWKAQQAAGGAPAAQPQTQPQPAGQPAQPASKPQPPRSSIAAAPSAAASAAPIARDGEEQFARMFGS